MTKNKISFDQKLEQKAINSNVKISKNFLWFIIAPLVLVLIGIILLCTVGFNLGTDFTGGSTFKIYVNNEGLLENAQVYDLNNKDDYNKVYDKIKTILDDNGLKIVSYRSSTMDLTEYRVFNGQAIEVIYANKASGKEIEDENQSIRGQLLTEFEYGEYNNAISTIDQRIGHKAFNYSMEILASIVVGLALVIVYMLLRKFRGVTIMTIMQVALDIILLFSLLLICRPVINLSIGIAFITIFVISILNIFAFLDKVKSGMKTGKYVNMKNNDIADLTIKKLFVKRTLIYIFLIVITLLFICLAVPGVRELAIALLLALVVSYYTSNFIMPALWATVYRSKKEKKNLQK